MRGRVCPREPAVARSLREGRWPAGLREHVDRCASCREAVRVAGWLQAVARDAERGPSPADAAGVWSRATLLSEVARRQELARRAARPAVWFQRVAALLAAAASATWVATGGEELRRAWAALAGGLRGPLPARAWPWRLDDPWTLALLSAALVAVVLLAGRAAIDRLDRP